MGIVGPYLSPYNYLEQNVELKNMPPRIQGLEKLGIFDGSEVLEVQKSSLAEYEDCIIKSLGTMCTACKYLFIFIFGSAFQFACNRTDFWSSWTQ